jgi:ADP-heptose:LPS heptosyltransferase
MAIALNPGFPQAHYNLGNALKITGQTDEAIVSYREAISLNPNYANAYTNLGVSLVKVGLLDEAIVGHQKAISINPNFVEAWRNLGNVLREAGQLNEAESAFKKALALVPDDPDTLFSWSLLDLQRGDFEEGWQKYEARFQAKKFAGDYPEMPVPRWQGQSLDGKNLFVWAEQGLGDAIQFVRYLEKIKQENVQIWLCCSPALHRLFQPATYIDKFVASDEVTAADYHIPLMSLPVVYKTTLESIPQHVPYVFPVGEIVEQWRERLQGDNGFRIGLSWAGNPDNDYDVFRSAHLKEFFALMSMPGVSIYSLQKGPGSEQVKELAEGMKIIDTTPDQTDLMATAGLIANLDLVISVDTAIVHLVGAMGRPVWMCLSANPDWRWLLERDDSPWYPTMRLYRQEQHEEWESVINDIETDLHKMIQ